MWKQNHEWSFWFGFKTGIQLNKYGVILLYIWICMIGIYKHIYESVWQLKCPDLFLLLLIHTLVNIFMKMSEVWNKNVTFFLVSDPCNCQNILQTCFSIRRMPDDVMKWTIIVALQQNMFPPRTLVMMYMERGVGGGNLKLKFSSDEDVAIYGY